MWPRGSLGRVNTQVDDGGGAGKPGLRKRLLSARSALTDGERREAADAILASALGLPELAGAGTVAAYVSVGAEPGTRGLVETLRLRGTRVLLPVLLEDDDLDWAVYTGPAGLVRARRGLLEPDGPGLGRDAVTEADAVLLPGLAVDARGLRLGRGGGSYDRVLERLGRAGGDAALVVLLYGDELLPRVPAEPHDRPVTAAVTPRGVHRF